ncbi:type II toxin-antitoxin system RelE/ParE family toxin [candidate division KSB1 bacterium]|nr:type II toxin-antitoxin system RelE/ParE family toxin [candidate division KSB1 bacterium]MBL7092585.1 type II toxin-antitoxin system RelE/ParE family toxin [candidate division KSB1 bacterium]
MIRIRGIITLYEVSEDLNDGKAFYDRRTPGLGDYFWDSLMADIESLYLFAGIHIKKSGYHRMISKRFPYSIYYEVKGDIARVVAVLPMRRDPAWIVKNLKRRSL